MKPWLRKDATIAIPLEKGKFVAWSFLPPYTSTEGASFICECDSEQSSLHDGVVGSGWPNNCAIQGGMGNQAHDWPIF